MHGVTRRATHIGGGWLQFRCSYCRLEPDRRPSKWGAIHMVLSGLAVILGTDRLLERTMLCAAVKPTSDMLREGHEQPGDGKKLEPLTGIARLIRRRRAF